MPTIPTTEASRLLQLDADLRREADQFLEASGFGQIIARAGYTPVGSYAMRTMAWRDLDFERIDPEPDWAWHSKLAQQLAEIGWAWRVDLHNEYRDPDPMRPGIYLGIRAAHPDGGPCWKFDLWSARLAEFSEAKANRELWMSAMTEETRLHILSIKEIICRRPEYGRRMGGVHIYQAVIEHGIQSVDDFLAWWQHR